MLDRHQADNYKWLCNTELKDTIDGMLSEDYKERFIAEYRQAAIRLDKLSAIIKKAKEHTLEFEVTNIKLLELQEVYMECYVGILKKRALAEGIDLD